MPEAYCIQEDGSVGILIHFAYAAPAGLMEQKGASFKTKTQAQWHVACAPEADLHAPRHGGEWPWHRSNDVRAVTCDNCKRTEPYRLALASLEAAHEKEQARI